MTFFHEEHFSDRSYEEIIDVISSKGYVSLRIDENWAYARPVF